MTHPPTAKGLRRRLLEKAYEAGWIRTGWKEAVCAQVRQLHKENPKLQNADETREIIAMLNEFRCRPTAWRLRVEDEAQGWGHPVLVLDFLEVGLTDDVDKRKRRQYERLWWRLDATEIMHLYVFRMDASGRLSPLVADTTVD